jgi:NADPH:quinone reductase-like Zn-dependent oxidoreductase
MRAVLFHSLGGLDTLKVEDVPEPEIGPSDVLVRVRSCGINRLDLRIREGKVGVRVQMPHIPGAEIAGDVAAFGSQVAGLSEGQRVVVAPYLFCGSCEFCLTGEETVCIRGNIVGLSSNGGYAEYASVPAANVVPIPDGVSYDDAAAVTLAALTAWHALVTRAGVRAGEELLVHSAGSGVGSAAIQIGRLCGARVITTASSDAKLELATRLGADQVINYAQQDFLQEVRRITSKRGVDLVLEHIGADTWQKSAACLSRNGRLVICGTTSGDESDTNLWSLFAKQLTFIGSYGGTRAELRTILRLVAEGRLKAVIDRVLPLERAAEAQRLMENRAQFGKLILNP